jgi:hypothetical protein
MRKLLVRMALGLALAFGLAGAGPAQAGVVNVTYTLTGMLSSLIGPLGPAAGSGTATITFVSPSATQSTILAGPIHVAAISFMQVINPPALGGGLTGNVVVTGASLTGSLTGGGGVSINGPLHIAAGFVHCFLGATQCAGIGLPNSFPVPLTSAPVGPLALAGLVNMGTPSSFGVSGAAGTFLGFPMSLSLTGTEVSRAPSAPEPSSLLLLGSAVGVLLLGAGRRLR